MKKTFHRTGPLSRRTVLQGALGGGLVSIALPTLDAMLNSSGTAYAQEGAFPLRFGFYFWGDGVILPKWTPMLTGAGYELTESLAPFVNVRDYLSVVSGCSVRTSGQGHHTGQVAMASGAPYIQQDPGGAPYASTFSVQSIDQLVADQWQGAGTRFRSLELMISERINDNEGTGLQFFSHNGPDSPNAPEVDPRAVFTRLFTDGFVAPTPGMVAQVDPRWALRRSVLDAVLQGATDLQPRLGRTDQVRIEQHLDSIRAVENNLMALEQGQGMVGAGCAAPMDPGEMPEVDGEPLIERTQAMSDLLTMALACDLTRVFTISFSTGTSSTQFPDLGIDGGRHNLTHDEAGDQPQVQAGTVFIMQQLATFMEKLQAMTEGDSNLLARSAVMASTDVAEGLPHSKDDYPVLVLGGAGGGLVNPGVHVRTDDANTSDIHFSVLTALGLPLTSFGAEEGESSTTIPELLA